MPVTQVRTKQQLLVTADVDFQSFKLINLADPTAAQHAATKAYVDAVKTGLDIKDSVRVATTGAETYTISAGAVTQINGTSVDGITLAIGDRILIKNAPASSGAGAGAGTTNTTQPANGIYVVTGNTTNLSVSRATDADANAEVTAGLFCFVAEGTANADNGYVLVTNDTITVNTTGLNFTQFSGAGQITAGAGLTKTGNTIDIGGTTNRIVVNADSIDIDSNYVGQTSIVTLGTITTGTWTATAVGVQYGGTGRASATAYMPIVGGTSSTGAHQSVSTGTTSGQALLYQGAAAVPVFGAINLAGGTNIVSGTLPAGNGGTGQSSYTIGDILYADSTSSLAKLAGVATGNALLSGGIGAAPSWGKIGLTTHVTGTLAIGNGGTGLATTPTNGQLLIGNGSGYTLATLTQGSNISITNGSGSITIAVTGVITTANKVTREVPTGTVNGSNTTFTLAFTPTSGTEEVFVNGVLQNAGAGNDYTISGGTITFLTGSIPQTGDVILVSYFK